MKLRSVLPSAIAAVALVLSLAAPAWADTMTSAMAAQAGATTSLSFQIVNQTKDSHSYDLVAAGLPGNAPCVFLQDGAVVTSVKLDGGGTTSVVAQVSVPADARPGSLEGALVARRDDGVEVMMPFVLDVENSFALKIASVSRSVSTFSGRDFTLDVTVSNTGTRALDNLTAAMDMPPKWVLRSDPAVLPSLAPGAEVTFHLTVTVPASQVAIEQPVKAIVKADQVTSAPSEVKVRVQSNPAFLPVTIGVLVVALVAVVVYFRLKGRR